MSFVFLRSAPAYAHDGVCQEQLQAWFLLVVVGWSVFISSFSMWIVYRLLKEAIRKNHTHNYLFTENDKEESKGESSQNVKRRIYNEDLQTVIDVILPKDQQ